MEQRKENDVVMDDVVEGGGRQNWRACVVGGAKVRRREVGVWREEDWERRRLTESEA